MRKYLIVAFAALTAMAFATVALAQTPDKATLTTKLTPVNAGTKKKPANAKLRLKVANANTDRTMSALDIFMPKTVKVSLKGLPSCDPATIFAKSCPKSTVLGTGVAKAKTGVNGTNPGDLTFDVKAFKTTSALNGKEMLGFYIESGTLQFLTETKLSKAGGKYGQKLHIDVPELAQHAGSSYNGLVSLDTTLSKKKGKNKLIATIGCKKKKHPFKVDLTFIDNGVTTGTVLSDTSTSKCTK
ncbi:MAG TPA: hypothetical protein VFX51_29495 [Solirubrobacteraceae bacterium]|nr:hypothetical protein [Solirubrobacteraceae bacterium]